MRAKCPTRDRFQPAAASLFAMLLAAGVVSPSLAYQQAPSLDQAVETGELPPVDERLPAEPLVVEPVEQIGSYGGTWNSGLRGGGDGAWLSRTVAYEGLVRWDRNWENIIPNIATSWEVSDDGRAFTFRLREGVRWSDGSPFTAEDVAFSLELSQDLAFPGEVPPWMRNPDNPPSWEVLDDYTIVVRFEQSNGMFMQELANVGGRQINHYNKAYCSQFYPKYNPEAESIAQERGFSDWGLLMLNRCATAGEIERWQNPELPSLAPWVLVEPYSGNARAVVLERNPYYFKVDPEGNQLPYIDRLEMRISESIDELTLMAMNGEIDFQDRHIATVTNKPVFFDNQERGDYRFLTTIPSSSNTMVLQLNLNHDDPVLREIFNNKDFRIGLSHAINRQEIIDVVFTGQGEPYQMAPRSESPFYDAEMAKQYTEYSPDLANQYLDQAGLTERDGEGYRLRSDGERLTLTVETIAALKPEWPDMLELMQLHLRDVGIDMQIATMDRTIFYDKREGNQFDAQVWTGSGGIGFITDPRYYMPHNDESVWAYRWQAWFNGNNPEIAEEPAPWAKQQMELYNQIRRSADEEEQSKLMGEILAIAKEQFPIIGISLAPDGYGIVKNNLRNVPDTMKHDWQFPTPNPYDPPQWYFEQ